MTKQEAIEILNKNAPKSDPRLCALELCSAIYVATKALQEQERKKGEWIYQNDGKVTCGACNTEAFHHGEEIDGEYKMFYYPTPFCPYCGADMRNNEEELRRVLAKEIGCDPDEITRIIT